MSVCARTSIRRSACWRTSWRGIRAAASLTHFNILAELHLQKGRHQRVADVVRTAADTFGNQELPIDLQVGSARLGVKATVDGACRPSSCFLS